MSPFTPAGSSSPTAAGATAGAPFTTIKVPENVRRWLKIESAVQGVPMYVVLMEALARGNKERPWEQVGVT